MVRKLFLIGLIIGLMGCSDDIEPIKVQEGSYLEADINGEFWEADDYFISEVKKVVDPSSSSKLLTRVTISGFTSDKRQISFTIDVANKKNYEGRYEPTYSKVGGLQEITWFDKASGSYQVYNMVSSDTTTNVRVRRHSNSKKVMSGTFAAVLKSSGGSTIQVSNGAFSNLNYE